MLIYKEMSLFDAPVGSMLVHACNCRGVWGSGVAAEFRRRFPSAFRSYEDVCKRKGSSLLGRSFVWHDGGYSIGCLMTSRDFGANVDSPAKIVVATRSALAGLLQQTERAAIYSPKFNAGLFKVPWSNTEEVLSGLLTQYPHIEWTVCCV